MEKVKICFRLKNHFSLLAPIWRNPDFPPSCQDSVFKLWHERGFDQLAKLYEGNTFQSFEGLKSKYSLQQSHLFRYLQVRLYIPKCLYAPNLNFLEEILKQPIQKRFISYIDDDIFI